MPLCRCGLHLADLRDTDEQLRWAERLGECWDYNDNGRGFWFFCVRCHAQRWPNDRRYQTQTQGLGGVPRDVPEPCAVSYKTLRDVP